MKEKTVPFLICGALLLGVAVGRFVPMTAANAQGAKAAKSAAHATGDADAERFQFFDSTIQGRTFLLDTTTGRYYTVNRTENGYRLIDAATGASMMRPLP